jgi:hypothetical protein
MIVKASACSALIIASGLFVPCVSPVQAESGTKPSVANSSSESAAAAPVSVRRQFRQVSRHKYRARKPQTMTAKADPAKSEPPAAAVRTVADDGKTLRDIPPSIANANAQMLLAGVQLSAAAAIPAGNDAEIRPDSPTSSRGDGEIQLVAAADQLNDVDRGLQEGQATAAVANPPPAPAATMAMTSDSTVWDQTSLMGKIFIGFGALLTMASAARMFIA